jgi:hypothetical protein
MASKIEFVKKKRKRPVCISGYYDNTDTCLNPAIPCAGKFALCRRSAALWNPNSCSPKLCWRRRWLNASWAPAIPRDISPAYYLSRSEQGRSKLTYVKKKELDTVRRQCAAYRAFQQNLRAWRQVTAALQQRWKQLLPYLGEGSSTRGSGVLQQRAAQTKTRPASQGGLDSVC